MELVQVAVLLAVIFQGNCNIEDAVSHSPPTKGHSHRPKRSKCPSESLKVIAMPLTIVGDPYQGWRVYRRREVVETVDWKQSETGEECDKRRPLSTRVNLTKCREQRTTGDTPCHWHWLWHKFNWNSGKNPEHRAGHTPAPVKHSIVSAGPEWETFRQGECHYVQHQEYSEMVIWVLAIIISPRHKPSL